MEQFVEIELKQLDHVQLQTTKNIKYLSAPPGTDISPRGLWVIAAIIGDELLLSKNNVIIKVPITDVLKISDHNVSDIYTALKGLLDHGKRDERTQREEDSKTG